MARRRSRTWTDKLVEFLSDKKCFTPLQDIYVGLGADTVGSKACIRGILYRNLKCGDHLFKRTSHRYAVTAVVRKCCMYFNRIF